MAELYDIVVIGSGPGGYIAALKAAEMGAKTAIVEKSKWGGTCLNDGCIPSKALLASAELIHKINHAKELGVTVGGEVGFDWDAIQKRKDKVIRKLGGGVKGLLKGRAVVSYDGLGKVGANGSVLIDDGKGGTTEIKARKTILAVGSVPSTIPGWPDDRGFVCTTDEALHWKTLPKRMLIVGGGVIGVEFACMMVEFGVEVTVVELMDQLLPLMERRLGLALAEVFAKRGIKLLLGRKVEDLTIKGETVKVSVSGEKPFEVDRVLVATGRRPNTANIGLDKLGVRMDRGFVKVDPTLATNVKDVYCIGDANGLSMLAHAASAQGEVAAQAALGKKAVFDNPVPGAVYTFPEIGSVGITTDQAREQGIPVTIGHFPIGHLGKAMAVNEEFGFARVIRHAESGVVLGVHTIGHNATETIEAATAMITQGAKIEDLADMIFAHPTIGESIKEAAADAFHGALHLPPRKVTEIAASVG
jgi:dihydrolipoamide dehydrogenase